MANEKKLHKAAASFRRAYPFATSLFGMMLDAMAKHIISTGQTEVTCALDLTTGKLNVYANN